MLFIVVMMFVIVALAAAVGLYVAFPHRGEDVPRASWLGQAMRRGVESLPTLETDDDAAAQELSLMGSPRTRR